MLQNSSSDKKYSFFRDTNTSWSDLENVSFVLILYVLVLKINSFHPTTNNATMLLLLLRPEADTHLTCCLRALMDAKQCLHVDSNKLTCISTRLSLSRFSLCLVSLSLFLYLSFSLTPSNDGHANLTDNA